MQHRTQSAKKNRNPAALPPLVSDGEVRDYNLGNLLRYLYDPKGGAREARFELGISSRAQEMGLALAHEQGVFVPYQVLARDLVVATPGAGGNLTGTEVHRGRLIDLLRPASAAIAAGAQVVSGLSGSVAIPRLTSGAAISWVGENSAPAEGQPAFDQVSMTPKTAAGYVDIARRLVLQTGADASAFVANDLRAGVASAIDQAALIGTGSGNQPRGILNTSGIGSIAGGVNGAAPSYDNVVDLEATVSNANTLLESPAFVTNSRVRTKLEKTQMFGGTNGIPIWRADGAGDVLKGRRAYVSNNVPNTLTKGTSTGVCSAIIYGNWLDLIIGLWGQGVTVMADPYTLGTSGGLRLIVMVDCDIAVRYPTSFSAMLDALTV